MSEYSEQHNSDDHDSGGGDFSPEVLERIELAWDAVDSDEFERAVELFHEARDLEPDNLAIDVELADLLMELGRPDEVIEICRTVLSTDGKTPRARRLLAMALHERGEHAEALPLLEAEALNGADESPLQVGLGDVLSGLQRCDEAVACYRRALELDSSSWAAHHGWGVCLAQQENFAAAIDHYQAALNIDENLPEVWLAWGDLLITLKDWASARAKLERAVEIDEEFAEAWECLSYVCEHEGDHAEAYTTLRRAIFWAADREELLDQLATTYHPHLEVVHSWEVTISGRYRYRDAVPPERTESHRFRRNYTVWAPDQETALQYIQEIESAMWEFELSVEEISPGSTAKECHGGVVFMSDRLYESPLLG